MLRRQQCRGVRAEGGRSRARHQRAHAARCASALQFLSITKAVRSSRCRWSRGRRLPSSLAGVYKPEVVTRLVPLFGARGPGACGPRAERQHGHGDDTRRGRRSRCLASPDVFDFSTPITVVANGRQVFSGRVQKSVPTLMKWAAIDNDRTMLYAPIHEGAVA